MIHLLNICGKFSVKETKKIYENLCEKFNKLLLSNKLTITNLIDLLYVIAKYNLIDVYEKNPFYVQFLIKFKSENLSDPVVFNDLPKLAWTLSLFALRTKEFNPIYHSVLDSLNLYLNETKEISTQNLKEILQSLCTIELLMKYNLTHVDFTKTFSSELLSSLLSLYVERTSHSEAENSRINIVNKMMYEEIGKINFINKVYTNAFVGEIMSYKEKTFPVIVVTDEDVNFDSKLLGEDYIKYAHMKSYTNISPLILNISEIKNRMDFEKEFKFYTKYSKTGYRKYLE